ncbi:agmatinase [Variovorax paradoxus]|jgi:guanidinopropionase|uniref:agmatinase n=1 Tax=Variovorax paradoxus TaxID=34073 RepID=UPI00041E40B1
MPASANSSPVIKPVDSFEVPRFSGLSTFMRTPFVPDGTGVDVAFVGVPFDFGTNRGGTRHGPSQVREMSRLIRRFNANGNPSPFDLCSFADIGDAPFNPLNPQASVGAIVKYFEELSAKGIVPISCGGDHGAAFPAMKGTATRGPVALIHFDAHPDSYHAIYGDRYNHGTLVSRGVEEGIIDPARTISIGIRGTRFALDDRDFNKKHNMRVVDYDEYESLGRAKVIEEIHRVVGEGPVYVTFDIDALDSCHCPGTGSPEPGGLSMRDAQMILRSLGDLDIVGADVCEIAPALDPQGVTALNAANLMFELACVAAEAAVRRKQRSL